MNRRKSSVDLGGRPNIINQNDFQKIGDLIFDSLTILKKCWGRCFVIGLHGNSFEGERRGCERTCCEYDEDTY